MASSAAVHEGIFAINKPPAITSAQVIRDVQAHFNPSRTFAPWLERERAKKDAESHNQRKKRTSWKSRQLQQVKIGHGGTLDPLATGVLILGIGSGTKSLGKFLDCTKSYETVLLFGAATDSYDTLGKIVARKGFEHVTRAFVEEKLAAFRGKIMQRPPIFSAKRIQGKRLYEYAREGVPLPEGYKIEECALRVEELEVMEWMEGGTHAFHWPEQEAAKEEKDVAYKVLNLHGERSPQRPDANEEDGAAPAGKRKRDDEEAPDITTSTDTSSAKRAKSSPEPTPATTAPTPATTASTTSSQPPCPAPAVRLRMTVTSGFYVRSLCHDLGAAVGSLGIMAALVRTRQGEFKLGVNTLWYDDLAKGEGVWGDKVVGMLDKWTDGEGGDAGAERAKAEVGGEEGDRKVEAKPERRARVRRNTSSEED
ncbi:hypothetical protein LTR08_001458 [Meristemomyces frigidus]|nr:hypothetical protein LTR08_001458 [Meristemomyces frigidus]